ncbi:glycosyltransferase family 25 protein [Acetobacter sp.]|uniref:glycosyltransferase family 25 protein n=1 Tax=Acetobacter sp. TaxID=440 RepID=UPI0039E8E068
MSSPPAFVISLERQPERLEAFFRNNPHHRDVTVFQAVDGWSLSRDDLIASGIIAPENRYVEPALGVLMSHLSLWSQAAEQNRTITVLEDDIILGENFTRSSQEILSTTKEFDVIFWGVNTDWPISVQPGEGMPEASLLFGKNISPCTASDCHSPSLFRLLSFAGLGAYTVTPEGARHLLKHLLPIGNIPAKARYFEAGVGTLSHFINWTNSGLDVELSRQSGNFRFYLSLPFLARSINDWSTSSFKRETHAIQTG